MKRHETVACAILAGLLICMALELTGLATAQTPPDDCQPGQDLIAVPEIRSEKGLLRAEITLTSGKRTLWGSAGDTRCVPQDLRYFKGRNLLKPGSKEDPAFTQGGPIPGPTLRARVGDLIQIKFLNHVDTQAFANSLDRAESDPENTTGCDEVRSDKGLIYPNPGSGGDKMPNCLHGSSTANLHFHGTHTTPDTTGDNILLFVRPALRSGPDRKIIEPNDAFADRMFAQIFSACERNGSPTRWQQLPAAWRDNQERLLREYDRTAPYQGKPGTLPPDMQLWPANEKQIKGKPPVWPQYQIGAYPYCFRLADARRNRMGQAPGTHWYHAHKHGSTALNVANGMTGAFIVEGQYDDDLRRFYGRSFRDQVLVIQQLSSTPFPVLNPAKKGPNSVAKPQLSVNGRLNPVVKMRPGEVQLWRLVNGAFRDAVQLQSFAPQGGLAWRQVAQDGVQFAYANYSTVGAVNRAVNLAPANRVDLLVKAPLQPGLYTLIAQPNAGLPLECLQGESGCVNGLNPEFFKPGPPITLLTVSVEGQAVAPAQDFIQKERDFPRFPAFLADIPVRDLTKEIPLKGPPPRIVKFGAVHNLIDDKTFNPDAWDQTMYLNTAEEWKVSNQANDKSHPFHIHVNPFQITEVFVPNAENTTDPAKPCYVDKMKPETWKPCTPLAAPYVWWDTFAIPTSKQFDVTSECNGSNSGCPAPIQKYVDDCPGSNAKPVCTLTLPGHFKMRSRFVDFTGTYVVHCHILIHEDRGMMQLVRVLDAGRSAPAKPPFAHH